MKNKKLLSALTLTALVLGGVYHLPHVEEMMLIQLKY